MPEVMSSYGNANRQPETSPMSRVREGVPGLIRGTAINMTT
jgi:hypothetical protein